jgi:hypothetical protein
MPSLAIVTGQSQFEMSIPTTFFRLVCTHPDLAGREPPAYRGDSPVRGVLVVAHLGLLTKKCLGYSAGALSVSGVTMRPQMEVSSKTAYD